MPLWRKKPSAYAAYLLGHEGQGGVLSALKALGLGSAVSATCFDYHGVASTFEVVVDLAEGALEEESLAQVGSVVFAYVAMLRALGPQAWVFEEMRQLHSLDFHYQYDTSAYNHAQDLAANVHHYPPEEVLAGDRLVYDEDPGAAAGVLSALRVDEARLWLVAGEYEGRCSEREPWYGGRFRKLPGLTNVS